MEQPVDSKCRMFYKVEEQIKHVIKYIIAGCATLAPSKYTNKHNTVAGYICWMLC
jgi:hypothetical protein